MCLLTELKCVKWNISGIDISVDIFFAFAYGDKQIKHKQCFLIDSLVSINGFILQCSGEYVINARLSPFNQSRNWEQRTGVPVNKAQSQGFWCLEETVDVMNRSFLGWGEKCTSYDTAEETKKKGCSSWRVLIKFSKETLPFTDEALKQGLETWFISKLELKLRFSII